jgi:5'-deoxynucleotidase YfbR-like HD superfamily hydrolase
MDLGRLKLLRRSGYVKRFHTLPTIGEVQSVSAHSWNVTLLINELFPDAGKQLLLAAMYHDVAEIIIGDMPATTKWKYPDLAEALAQAEEKVERELNIQFALTEREKIILKMCDMLELVLYSAEQLKLGNDYFEEVLSNGMKYLLDKYSNYAEFSVVSDVLKQMVTR